MNKRFKLDDIFDIYSPPKRFNANEVKFDGKYPYVARGSSNNGIRGYITEEEKYLSPAKTLSFGQDTATVFYQPDAYFTGDKIKVMVLKNRELTTELAMYFITAISKAFSSFVWGQNSFNEEIIKSTKVSLPVIERSDPNHEYTVDDIDWEYMRDRITELDRDRIIKLDAYLQANGLNDCELTEEEKKVLSDSKDSSKFGKFKATSLFDIKKGKRLTKADMIDGNINFVGSSASNNGITARIGNTEHLHPAHTFTVSYNGSVGEVFLQDEQFWASDDVNVWYPKFPYNQRVIEYIMSVVRRLKVKYSYTAKWTLEKMQAEILELPITSDGKPDFDYMECYIRAMEKVVIADVVKYKNKVIEATKEVVGE